MTKKLLLVLALVLGTAAFAAAPTSTDASGEIYVFKGTLERLDNVEYTVKPVGSGYLVFGGSDTSDVRDALLTVRGNRIYRGYVLNNSNVLFTVRGNRIINGLTVRVTNTEYTIRGNRIFRGRRVSLRNVAYTLSGTSGRAWLYSGSRSTGWGNVRFTVRGDVDGILPLLPILADWN